MKLPTREEAAGWIGHRVNDTGGAEIGTCIKIYADDDTEALEWIGVAVHGGANAVVPIGGATETGGTIQVAFTRDAVLAAPVAASLDFLSREDEVSLYEHYGVPYTSAASPTTLPLGEDPAADLERAAGGVQDSTAKERAVKDRTEAATPASRAPDGATLASTARDSTAPSASAPDTLTPAASAPDTLTPAASAPDTLTPAASAASASAQRESRVSWPIPEPLPTSRVVPALVVAGSVVAGAAAVRWLPIRRKPAPIAPRSALSRALDRVPPVHFPADRLSLPTDRLSGIDAAEVARRAGWGVMHAAMIPTAYGAMAAQRTADVVRDVAPRAGAAVQQAGRATLSEANRAVTTTAETASATVAGITGAAESIYDTWRTTMGLLKNSVILGAGYVLGTRAGREQYEVIKAKANEVAHRPAVQQATGKVKGAVSQKLPGASRRSGYASTSTYSTTSPTSVTAPPTPATPTGVQDPVTPPRDVTIDLTSDVPSSTERRT
jgi:hypothetical protein